MTAFCIGCCAVILLIIGHDIALACRILRDIYHELINIETLLMQGGKKK